MHAHGLPAHRSLFRQVNDAIKAHPFQAPNPVLPNCTHVTVHTIEIYFAPEAEGWSLHHTPRCAIRLVMPAIDSETGSIVLDRGMDRLRITDYSNGRGISLA